MATRDASNPARPDAGRIDAKGLATYKRILVPIDGSDTAESGLREAIGIASAVSAAVVLLSVALERLAGRVVGLADDSRFGHQRSAGPWMISAARKRR